MEKSEHLKAIEALKWYIKTDETNYGQTGNEYYEAGRARAILIVDEYESIHGLVDISHSL